MYPNLQIKLENLLTDKDLTGVEQNKLRQFIGMLTAFISEWFRKTITLIVPKHEQPFVVSEKAVMEFLKPAMDIEAEKKNQTPYVDNDMWGWNSFKGKTIPAMLNELTLAIYRFIKAMTHRQILAEGEAKGIKHIGTYLEALATIRAGILAGEVDQRNTGIIAYFKIDGNDQLYRFHAWRHDGGQLHVHVNEMDLGNECDPEDGVCFSN